MNMYHSDINTSIKAENSQILAVETYSFLVPCSKRVYLSGLHMRQQHNTGNI